MWVASACPYRFSTSEFTLNRMPSFEVLPVDIDRSQLNESSKYHSQSSSMVSSSNDSPPVSSIGRFSGSHENISSIGVPGETGVSGGIGSGGSQSWSSAGWTCTDQGRVTMRSPPDVSSCRICVWGGISYCRLYSSGTLSWRNSSFRRSRSWRSTNTTS